MRKRIVLFACIEKNIGDDLFIYTIANRYRECRFIISSEANYGVLKDQDNLIFDDDLRKWIKYSNDISRNPIRKMKRIIGLKKQTSKIGHFDVAIYIVGNAFKNLQYHGRVDSRWIIERMCLSDRFYLISTNFGPYIDERWEKDCKDVFGRMTDVCFRDKSSYNIFRMLPNVRCKPDAILSLGKKNHLENDHIVVSMIDCVMPGRPEKLKFSGPLFENKICEIVNYYISLGKKIILLNSNTLQDSPASKRVFDRVQNHNSIRIYNYDGAINEVLDIFAHAEIVFATRLHTIILSWIFSVPVIPIVYDIKVRGLLDECHFNGFYVDICDIDRLNVSDLQEIIDDYRFELSEDIIKNADEQFAMIDVEIHGK